MSFDGELLKFTPFVDEELGDYGGAISCSLCEVHGGVSVSLQIRDDFEGGRWTPEFIVPTQTLRRSESLLALARARACDHAVDLLMEPFLEEEEQLFSDHHPRLVGDSAVIAFYFQKYEGAQGWTTGLRRYTLTNMFPAAMMEIAFRERAEPTGVGPWPGGMPEGDMEIIDHLWPDVARAAWDEALTRVDTWVVDRRDEACRSATLSTLCALQIRRDTRRKVYDLASSWTSAWPGELGLRVVVVDSDVLRVRALLSTLSAVEPSRFLLVDGPRVSLDDTIFSAEALRADRTLHAAAERWVSGFADVLIETGDRAELRAMACSTDGEPSVGLALKAWLLRPRIRVSAGAFFAHEGVRLIEHLWPRSAVMAWDQAVLKGDAVHAVLRDTHRRSTTLFELCAMVVRGQMQDAIDELLSMEWLLPTILSR